MSESGLKMEVHYEWVIEHVDEYGDIRDHDRADSLNDKFVEDALRCTLNEQEYHEGLKPRLALIRSRGSGENGLDHRSYAYTYKDNGVWKIEDETDSGHTTPARYKNQLSTAQERLCV